MKQKMKFVHNWISNLMKNMDNHLDEAIKIKLMEECGRACARNHTKKDALKFKGQLDGWLAKMKTWVGEENIQKEGNLVRVVYNKCFCPIIQDSQLILSDTYCNCSRGWLKENFETVLERPVKVKLEDSIMKGGKQCSFLVFLKE
jgi:predicted hydrocarbon binding protein